MAETITAGQLRAALFHLEDQEMTIGELRRRLFNVEDQDAAVEIDFSMWRVLGVEKPKSQKDSK